MSANTSDVVNDETPKLVYRCGITGCDLAGFLHTHDRA